jgi:hypothetical protein
MQAARNIKTSIHANCFAIGFIWEPLFFGVSSAARVAGNSTLIWALPPAPVAALPGGKIRGALKDEKGEKKQKEAVPQGPPLFFLEMVFSS